MTVLVAASTVIVLLAVAAVTVAVSRSSSDDAAPATTTTTTTPAADGTTPATAPEVTARSTTATEPTDEGPDSTEPGPTAMPSEGTATDDDPAVTTADHDAAAGASTPPSLPGPTCASIPHGEGPWEAIDPSCVKIRDFDDPANNFGAQVIAVAPSDPNVIMVGTNYQGVWRSTDRGDTWTRTSNVNRDGVDGCNVFDGRNWALEIDPDDPDHILTANGYGCNGSGWQSFDGGVTWNDTMPAEFMQSIAMSGVYDIDFDPTDSKHILMAFHDRWEAGASGVAESTDGGHTWVAHQPRPTWGAGHYVHFLDNSDSWLLATQEDGLWRTTNRGADWEKVSDENMSHGMNQMYRAASGTLYLTMASAIMKSTDAGASWSTVFPTPCTDGFGGLIGDGTRLYTAPANTGRTTCGDVSYYSALESDDDHWTEFGSQTFHDGPMNFAIDPVSRTIYSSNWNGGIWRLSY